MIRVLHIDDEAPVRLLVRVNLEAEGMEVMEAADGKTGLRLAKREQPDLILLDVLMPGLDGWQVAGELHQDQEMCEIPIVFLTAMARFEDRARGLDLGAVDYILEPFNPVELAPRLRGVLERLERGERDELRREKILGLLPLTFLARAVQAQVAKTPRSPPEVVTPLKQQADAIAEMQRLGAQLGGQRPLLSGYVARDVLGHVSMLRLPAPAIDLEQERAVDQAVEDIRAHASNFEGTYLDSGTRRFLRDLPEDERRHIREKLAALILAMANDVLVQTEGAKDRSLVRLVTALYVLMVLYSSVTRSVDAVEGVKTEDVECVLLSDGRGSLAIDLLSEDVDSPSWR